MERFTPDRSYLICTVQRTGSQLFCILLQDTGLVGFPPAHDLCTACWKESWTSDEFSADVDHALRAATGPNGIPGSRMFWNAWERFLERSRAVWAHEDADDIEVLAAVFSELQFVWLRRRDKLRQAISFWRATTGEDQFRYPTDGTPVNVPEFDFDRISFFIEHVSKQEDEWRDWFDRHEMTPRQVIYEDLVSDRAGVIRDVLEYLQVGNVENVAIPEPRVVQQADEQTERYIQLYEEERERRSA